VRYDSLIRFAESLASDIELPHKVVAFAVSGGRVMDYGVNQLRYNKNRSVFGLSVHAEMDLLNRMYRRGKTAPESFRVYTYRFNRDDATVRCAKPCQLCQHYLKASGCTHVQYVNDCGIIERMAKRDFTTMASEPKGLTELFIRNNGVSFNESR